MGRHALPGEDYWLTSAVHYIGHIDTADLDGVFLESQLPVELALNLVWVGLAAAFLTLWFVRRRTFVAEQRSAIALLALVCVICVLFPVISMTDDLNASPAEPETVKSKLAVMADFIVSGGLWILVYDPCASSAYHQVETQLDFPLF